VAIQGDRYRQADQASAQDDDVAAFHFSAVAMQRRNAKRGSAA
jgi:hypothetical protein